MTLVTSLNQPLVSIGVPVYNGEVDIGLALDCLLSQTYANLEIIISDNASTDRTDEVCRQYAGRDRRIIYIRQPVNLGATENFAFVLNRARGEYFMWAAADDTRSSGFVECNLNFLRQHSDYAGSTSPVILAGESFKREVMGDCSLDGDKEARFVGFFKCWHSNGRFYSLFRKDVVDNCVISKSYLGSDWAIVLAVLSQGKLNCIDAGEVVLGRNGASKNDQFFKKSRSQWYEYIFPFYKLSMFVIEASKEFSPVNRIRLICMMIKFNFLANAVRFKLVILRIKNI